MTTPPEPIRPSEDLMNCPKEIVSYFHGRISVLKFKLSEKDRQLKIAEGTLSSLHGLYQGALDRIEELLAKQKDKPE